MFRHQVLFSSNCCLLFSARGRHREQQIVVDVAQLVGPLVSVHDTPTLLSDLDCLAYPPCSLVWLTGDDRGLVPVDDVIFLVDVICDCRFVLFWLYCFFYVQYISIRSAWNKERLYDELRTVVIYENRRDFAIIPPIVVSCSDKKFMNVSQKKRH